MNKFLKAMLIGVGLLATPVSAQVYVGAGLGVATTDVEHSSYRLFAGFDLIPNLELEMAYNNFGNYRGENADAYSIAGVVTFPLTHSWDLFGKLGATENHTGFAGSTNHKDMLSGFGFVYRATREVSLRFEYESFGRLMDDGKAFNSNVSNWGLNLKSLF